MARDFLGDFYNVMLIIHIAAAITAFAPVILAPALQANAKSLGDEAVKAQATTMKSLIQSLSMGSLVVVIVTGVVMVIDADLLSMADAWISASFVVWFLIAGAMSGLVGMGERTTAEGDMSGMRFVTLGSAAAGALGIVMLYLMIFKPGM